MEGLEYPAYMCREVSRVVSYVSVVGQDHEFLCLESVGLAY